MSKIFLPAGHVMELVCDDSQRLATSGEWFIQYLIVNLIHSMCVIGWLFYFVGWQAFLGSLFLIGLGLYRFLVSKVDYKLRKSASQRADKRLGYLRKIIANIHSIKLNCMEEISNENVRKTRW